MNSVTAFFNGNEVIFFFFKISRILYCGLAILAKYYVIKDIT